MWLADDKLTITWTGIPSGVNQKANPKQIVLKVIVAPVLDNPQAVPEIIKDVFTDWPETVRKKLKHVQVYFGTDEGAEFGPIDATVDHQVLGPSSSWKDLIGPVEFLPSGISTEAPIVDKGSAGSSYNPHAADDQFRARRLLHVVSQHQERVSAGKRGQDGIDAYLTQLHLENVQNFCWSMLAWGNESTQIDTLASPLHGSLREPDDPLMDPRAAKILDRNRFRLFPKGLRPAAETMLRWMHSGENAKVLSGFAPLLNPINIAECTMFHSRAPRLDTGTASDEAGVDAKPEDDFPRRIGRYRYFPLGEHLGLTLRVLLTTKELEAIPGLLEAAKKQPSSIRVWVTPKWDLDAQISNRSPGVRCDLNIDSSKFVASELTAEGAQDPELSDGYLRLDPTIWRLSTVDVDGTSLKAFHFAHKYGEITPKIVTDLQGHEIFRNWSAKQSPVARLFQDAAAQQMQQRLTRFSSFFAKIQDTGAAFDVWNDQVQVEVVDGETKSVRSVSVEVRKKMFGSVDNAVLVWTFGRPAGEESEKPPSPPSCRSVGIALSRSDAANDMAAAEARNAELFASAAGPGKPILVASDLILGYVPEIWAPPAENANGGGRWYSTTRRRESYPALKINIETEGYVNVGVGEVQDAAPADHTDPATQGAVSPNLFVYSNRPLGAPLSGTSWNLPGENAPSRSEFGTLTPLAESLPLLRFSHESNSPFRYAVRCRYMDVAGNVRLISASTPTDDPTICLSTMICRDEPVPPPRVLTNGQLDIRENVGAKCTEMVSISHCDMRVLIPPKVSADVALQYGKLLGGSIRNGGFVGAQLDADAEIPELKVISAPPPTSPAIKDSRRTTKENVGQLTPVYQPRTDLSRPNEGFYYFPDPMCAKALFRLHTFHSEAYKLAPLEAQILFYQGTTWPHATPIYIKLCSTEAANVEAQLQVVGNCLNIYLPLGWTGILEISSGPPDGTAGKRAYSCDHFAAIADLTNPHQLLFGADHTAALKALRTSVASPLFGGLMESLRILNTTVAQLTANLRSTAMKNGEICANVVFPSQEITLVAATRSPLLAPVLKVNGFSSAGSAPRRPFGHPDLDPVVNAVPLQLEVEIDEKSTEKVDVTGVSSRLLDDPLRNDLVTVVDKYRVADQLQVPKPCEIGASVHRWNSVVDLGTARFRRVVYSATACSRFAAYFPKSKPATPLAGANNVIIDHLNVATPDTVPLRYLVPTITWTSQTKQLHTKPKVAFETSAQFGIRIYLGRGWEEEEFLGVLVAPTHSEFELEKLSKKQPVQGHYLAQMPDELVDRISEWGADPIVDSTVPNRLPAASDFLKYEQVGGQLQLPAEPGNPGGKRVDVSVLGYRRVWNPDLKLWYCDVGLKQVPSMGCFVRLVLTRYQPYSEEGFELSQPSVADFIQVSAKRTITVMRDAVDATNKSLRVIIAEPSDEGRTPLSENSPSGDGVTHKFEVEVYQPCTTPDGHLIGWVPDKSIQLLLEPSKLPEVLWAGKLIWPQVTGARRLVVRELEVWNTSTGTPQSREVFSNAIDL
jgi:hypothetical protein